MAVAAAATAPGGAAMYPTVVGDTGGLEERGSKIVTKKPLIGSTTQNKDETENLYLKKNPNTTEKQS